MSGGKPSAGGVGYLNQQLLVVTGVADIADSDAKDPNTLRPSSLEKSGQPKILIIDGDPDISDVLDDVLHDDFPRIKIQIARDGFDAGKKIIRFKPDVVILDFIHPELDGLTICQNIRSDPSTSNTKVIVITDHDTPNIRQNVQGLNVQGYFTKPIPAKDLKKSISHCLKNGSKKKALDNE